MSKLYNKMRIKTERGLGSAGTRLMAQINWLRIHFEMQFHSNFYQFGEFVIVCLFIFLSRPSLLVFRFVSRVFFGWHLVHHSSSYSSFIIISHPFSYSFHCSVAGSHFVFVVLLLLFPLWIPHRVPPLFAPQYQDCRSENPIPQPKNIVISLASKTDFPLSTDAPH